MLSSLAIERSNCRERLRELRAQLIAARLEQSRGTGARRSENHLDGSARNALLIIYILSNYERFPAIVYLKRCRAMRHLPHAAEADLHAMLEDEFLRADLREMSALADMHNSSDPEAFNVASKVLAEWKVVQWVVQQNAVGVTPSTAEMLSHCTHLPPSALTRTKFGKPSRTARMWASRRIL